MWRIFRDSVTPSAIPLEGISGVLGYANGRYRWMPRDIGRFIQAGLQRAMIDVSGTVWQAAAILDVERYDATPETARTWIPQRNTFRGDATVYCGKDSCEALFAATSHLPGPYWLIVADWTGKPHIPVLTLPPNVRLAGCQYLNTAEYDESVITDDRWHRAAPR
jgi:hypothetical protein